jgi:predicted nucleotidyltransferase
MDKNAVIAVLREHEAELRRMGVVRLSLFGSVARGEAGPESDVDVAVDLDPAKTPEGLWYVGLLVDVREKLESVLGRPVDVVDEKHVKRVKADLERDRVVAFQ